MLWYKSKYRRPEFSYCLERLSSHTCNAHVLRAGSLLTYSNKIVRHLTYKHSCKSHFAWASFCTLSPHKRFISAKEPKMSWLTVFKGSIFCVQMLPSLSIGGLKRKPGDVTHEWFYFAKNWRKDHSDIMPH